MKRVVRIEFFTFGEDGVRREWVTIPNLPGEGWLDYYSTREEAAARAAELGVPFVSR